MSTKTSRIAATESLKNRPTSIPRYRPVWYPTASNKTFPRIYFSFFHAHPSGSVTILRLTPIWAYDNMVMIGWAVLPGISCYTTPSGNCLYLQEKKNVTVEEELAKFTAEDSVLTIGVFDGVHLGHRHLISELLNQAKQKKVLSGVVTF